MDHLGEPVVEIVLNGKPREVAVSATIARLLEDLGLQERLVVVEHNGVIVARPSFSDVVIESGDVLEIVHFVGGG